MFSKPTAEIVIFAERIFTVVSEETELETTKPMDSLEPDMK